MRNKLLILPLALIFLAVLVSASGNSVTVSLFYDATTSDSLQIMNGDDVGIVVSADSIFENSMNVRVDFLGTSETNLLDVDTIQDSYFKHMVFGQEVYLYPGTYSIKATVTGSPSGKTDVDYLYLEVLAPTPQNRLPVITSTPVTQVNEGANYAYDVQATDADGDTLVYSLTTAPMWLSINSQTGLITGTAPQVSADTQYNVVVSVSDGKGSVTQSYVLTVKNVVVPPVNNPPVITSTPISQINEGQNYVYDVDATDADGDTLVYSLTQKPSWLSINSQTGLITGVAPQLDADYEFIATVKVYDGKDFDTQVFTITVKNVPTPPVNHLPVITSTPVTQVNEGQNYVYDVNANDADGDTLTYSLTTAPSWLSINSQTGLITGTAPQVTSDTNYNVVVSVSDGKGSVSQAYTLTVKNIVVPPQNNLPVITSTPVTQVNEGQNYVYDVNANDADGDTLVYSLTQAPSWLSINSATGLITGTAPQVNADTQYNVVVSVSDGKGSVSQSYVLTVKNVVVPPVNNLPVITSTPVTQVNEGQNYVYDVNATDQDGDILVYSLTTAPSWLSINSATGLITGTAPQVNADTQYNVVVSVSDGKGSVSQSYVLTVKNVVVPPVNNLPVITSTPVTQVNEGQNYVYDVNATDQDGDILVYSLTTAPSWLSINSATGLITGTAPQVNADTQYNVVVSVSDGKGSVSQSYVLTVKNVVVPPVNNLPVITSTPVTQVNEGQNYVYDVNANDADGDTLTYSLTTAPSWLSINSATGLITGTAPQVNADTAFSVTVKVSDGTGFVTQSYTLTVKNVPIVPPPSNGPSGKDGDGERIRTLPLDDFYNAKYLSQFNPPIVLSEEPEAPVKGKISLAGKILLWLFILIILLIILIIIFWLRRM